MKIEKKHWIIIGIVIAIIAVWYFFLRKKKNESSFAIAAADCNNGNQKCYKRSCGGEGMHCHNKPATSAVTIESNYRASKFNPNTNI